MEKTHIHNENQKNQADKQISRDKKKKTHKANTKKEKKVGKKRGETIRKNQRRKKPQKKTKDRNIDHFQSNNNPNISRVKKSKQSAFVPAPVKMTPSFYTTINQKKKKK